MDILIVVLFAWLASAVVALDLTRSSRAALIAPDKDPSAPIGKIQHHCFLTLDSQRKGLAMAERLTKSAARNVFYGGSAFFFAIFIGLTAHSHYYMATTSTDARR